VHTVKVYDTSSDCKTADHLLMLLEEVRKHLEMEWGVTVVAVTSDASGESRKARRMLYNIDNSLVVPDCYAHQV
jgi:hypothetical protein